MALTPEQSAEVQTAMTKLRGMGCAVCIFMPEDVESAAEADERNISPAAAADPPGRHPTLSGGHQWSARPPARTGSCRFERRRRTGGDGSGGGGPGGGNAVRVGVKSQAAAPVLR